MPTPSMLAEVLPPWGRPSARSVVRAACSLMALGLARPRDWCWLHRTPDQTTTFSARRSNSSTSSSTSSSNCSRRDCSRTRLEVRIVLDSCHYNIDQVSRRDGPRPRAFLQLAEGPVEELQRRLPRVGGIGVDSPGKTACELGRVRWSGHSAACGSRASSKHRANQQLVAQAPSSIYHKCKSTKGCSTALYFLPLRSMAIWRRSDGGDERSPPSSSRLP